MGGVKRYGSLGSNSECFHSRSGKGGRDYGLPTVPENECLETKYVREVGIKKATQMVCWWLPTHLGWEEEGCGHDHTVASPKAQEREETGCGCQVKGSPELKGMLSAMKTHNSE